MKIKKKDYRYDITLFFTSALIMIIELLASRILAPYIGTAYSVWVGVIGVVMGSMSIGNIIGGKIADKNKTADKVPFIFTLISIYLTIIYIMHESILTQISTSNATYNIKIIAANIILFAMPNILFGIISPYIFKLKLAICKEKGKELGYLDALTTIGSLVGTFLVGMWILPAIGTMNVLGICIILISLLGMINTNKLLEKNNLICTIIILLNILFIFNYNLNQNSLEKSKVLSVDSQYSRIIVRERETSESTYRDVLTDPYAIQSSTDINNPNDINTEYIKYYDLINEYKPDFKETLILGGGAFTYPKYYVETYPDKEIDVVEIDEKYIKIAEEYFFLKPHTKMNIINQDARMYINKTNKKYDAILNDCFNSVVVPPQMITSEFIKRVKTNLKRDGTYIMNFIAPLAGDTKILDTTLNTIYTQFEYIDVYKINNEQEDENFQNLIIVATDRKVSATSREKYDYKKNPKNNKIFTDDNCPIDVWMLQYFK